MGNLESPDRQPSSRPSKSRWKKILVIAVGAVVGLVVLGTIVDPAKNEEKQAAPPSTTPSSSSAAVSSSESAVASPPGPPAGFISRATWTDSPWPFTVDAAVLECQGDELVTIKAGDATYALNAAAAYQTDLPDAKEISIPDPAKPGFSLDAGKVIQRGLALCLNYTPPSGQTGGSNRAPGFVERATWTDGPWPFTTDSATLMCTNGADGERVTVTANREMYALNGTAKSSNLFPDFDVIWRDDPDIPGAKVSIGLMIERGLALCQG